MRIRPGHRAFALMEILGALAVLAVFAIVLSQLFLVCQHAQMDALRRTDLAGRVDSSLGRLRADIWTASAMHASPDGTLHLTLPAGEAVWSNAPLQGPTLPNAGHRLVRSEAGHTLAWNAFPAMRFAVAGPVVTITFQTAGETPNAAPVDESLTAVSSRMLSQEAAP